MSNGAIGRPYRKNFWPVLVLVAMPLILAMVHRDWLYTQIGYLDPWFNVGLFLHYSDPTFLAGHYKESRLSWIAPGFVLYRVVGPWAANMTLHLGALIVATVFLYLSLVRLVARQTALIIATLLTFYVPFLGSGGWDYQTTPSGAYYAVTLYCVTRAAEAILSPLWLFLSGIAFAATFHSDIIFVNMVPVLVAQYFALGSPRRTWKDIAQAALWPLLGFVALTLALCIFAWSFGRAFFFFWPIVRIVFHYVGDTSTMQSWWLPWSNLWFTEPIAVSYLAAPFTVLMICMALFVAYRFRSLFPFHSVTLDRTRLFLIGQFVFLALLWIFWQSIGHVALEPEYFAYPLIIPMMVGLAGLRAPRPVDNLLPALIFAATLTATLIAARFGLGIESFRIDWTTRLLVLTKLAAFGAVVLAFRIRPVSIGTAASCVAFPAFLLLSVNSYPSWSSLGRECSLWETEFETLMSLDSTVQRLPKARTFVWLGPTEPEALRGTRGAACGNRLPDLKASFSSLGYPTLGTAAQSTEDLRGEEAAALLPGDQIVALVFDKDQVDALESRLHRAGKILASVLHEYRMFQGKQVSFQVLVVS